MKNALIFIIAVVLVAGGYFVLSNKSDDDSAIVFKCTIEQRESNVCIEIYQPVCGRVNVRCVTSPCNPVHETFSNSCFACQNSLVDTYTEGECVSE